MPGTYSARPPEGRAADIGLLGDAQAFCAQAAQAPRRFRSSSTQAAVATTRDRATQCQITTETAITTGGTTCAIAIG